MLPHKGLYVFKLYHRYLHIIDEANVTHYNIGSVFNSDKFIIKILTSKLVNKSAVILIFANIVYASKNEVFKRNDDFLKNSSR